MLLKHLKTINSITQNTWSTTFRCNQGSH